MTSVDDIRDVSRAPSSSSRFANAVPRCNFSTASIVLGSSLSNQTYSPMSNSMFVSNRQMSSNSSSDGTSNHEVEFYSSSGASPPASGDGAAFPSVDDSTSSLLPSFGSKPISPEDVSDVADAADAITTLPFEPTWWPSDQLLLLLNHVHDVYLPAYPYAVTIGVTTLAARLLLFPIYAAGQRNSSRMAHMQPEMKKIMDATPKQPDQATQQKVMAQTRALWRKYDCNPMKGLVVPLASFPFFMGMFFGLKKAPDYFPDLLSNGGLFWFTDLTQADPLMILPVLSAGTFLVMTELTKDQMMSSDPVRGRNMVNAMRALAIVMVPLTAYFNSAVLCYWVTNNSFTMGQSLFFKLEPVKKMFGIWDPPKPVPGQETKGLFDEVQKLMAQKEEEVNALAEERIKAHNEIVAKQKKVRQSLMKKEGLKKKGEK